MPARARDENVCNLSMQDFIGHVASLPGINMSTVAEESLGFG
jgi:hypothetical protein